MQSLTYRVVTIGLLCLCGLGVTSAQTKNDPLNDSEVDQVREVADQPIERIKLYIVFIEQRTSGIKELVGDTRAQGRPEKLHNLMDEYTRLVDELQDNLDNYDAGHSDVRKELKEVIPKVGKWPDILNRPPPDQAYDFSRKTALEASRSLADQLQTLQASQNKWFAEHKNDKNDKKDKNDTSSPPPAKE